MSSPDGPQDNKSRIANILRTAPAPLSLDEICSKTFGQVTERIRSTVRVNLYRLDTEGVLIKSPRKYALKKKDGKKYGND